MNQNWKILLLGGSGAVGKSTLARQISKHYNIPLMEVVREINSPEVATIFLYDDMENLQKREGGRIRAERLEQNRLVKQTQFSFSYGEYIKTQAHTLGLNTIKASPINTLFERIISIR